MAVLEATEPSPSVSCEFVQGDTVVAETARSNLYAKHVGEAASMRSGRMRRGQSSRALAEARQALADDTTEARAAQVSAILYDLNPFLFTRVDTCEPVAHQNAELSLPTRYCRYRVQWTPVVCALILTVP